MCVCNLRDYTSSARVVFGDINPRDNEGMTPLHCAAHFGRAKHITLMSEGMCGIACAVHTIFSVPLGYNYHCYVVSTDVHTIVVRDFQSFEYQE